MFCLQVKSLSGLSRFPVLGILKLGCNDLDWKELKHLSHMTIVSLTLLGNDRLDSDPHCMSIVSILFPLIMCKGLVVYNRWIRSNSVSIRQ